MLERKWQARMTNRTQSAEKKYSSGKVRKLNNEALTIVVTKAKEIAEALFESTTKGHVMSAHLLIELAEGSVTPEEAANRRQIRSLALRLANEPQVANDPQRETENSEPETRNVIPA
jgi:hypothetical protein